MVAIDTDDRNVQLASGERLDSLRKRSQQLPLTWVRVPDQVHETRTRHRSAIGARRFSEIRYSNSTPCQADALRKLVE